MRFLSILLLGIFFQSSLGWETDFDKAVEKAQLQHKLILLSFSGSDWCVPCIRLHKEILDTNPFKDFADSSLILVNADFPRLKKNQLTKEQQKKNNALADRYNPQGSFPFTVLIDENRKVLMSWEGYPDMSPGQYTAALKKYVDARK